MVLDYDVTLLPPKKYFLPQKEKLIRFRTFPDTKIEEVWNTKPLTIIGVHPYDLKAINQLDHLLESMHPDTHYLKRQLAITIIGVTPKQTSKWAFWAFMDSDHVKKGFDLWSKHCCIEYHDIEYFETVDHADKGWKGNVGVITTLFPKIKLDAQKTSCIIVGPPVMYRFVIKEAMDKGIDVKNIYVSLERRMKCGVGKCGHCQINGVYCCQDGPVFRYSEILEDHLEEAL